MIFSMFLPVQTQDKLIDQIISYYITVLILTSPKDEILVFIKYAKTDDALFACMHVWKRSNTQNICNQLLVLSAVQNKNKQKTIHL